jgi:hypothetical protein
MGPCVGEEKINTNQGNSNETTNQEKSMKKRNLLSGLFLAAMLSLGLAGIAQANSFSSCDNFNNSNPAAPTGDVTITNSSGGCSLSNPALSSGLNSLTVTSTGGAITTSTAISTPGAVSLTGTAVTVNNVTSTGNSAYLKATSGDVTAADITAKGSSIQVLAPAGKITVSGTVNGTNLTQIFSAQTTISLQAVNNANGDVRIFAQQGGGGTEFKIGSSSTNGVMSVHNNATSGGGWDIYISNGTGAGGINYNGSDLLQVQGSPAGGILLDGHANGKVTLAGDLNANGGSGVVEVYSPEVIAANAMTISASAPGQNIGYINLVTAKITTTADLTLNINGNGPFSDYTDLSLFPVGSHTVMAPTDPTQPITFGPYAASAKPLTIEGAGTLTINADGNTNGMKIYGYPLTITAKTRINQKGSGNFIGISGSDGTSNLSTITFGGDIQVHENTGAAGDAQGAITLAATSISGVTKNVLLDASGATGTGGDGSPINLSTSTGTLSLGDTATDITLNADGSDSGGKGGNITVYGGTGAVTINSGNAVLASAQSGDGDGGFVDIEASSVSSGTGPAAVVNADSKGTGNAGTIQIITGGGTLNLGTGAGKLSLSASGTDGKGNGGTIELAFLSTITVSNDISVAAGTGAGGNGQGGTFNIHDFDTFQATNIAGVNLIADGHGSGNAGSITILSQNSNPIVLDDATLSASGDPAGTGNGGQISVTDLGSISVSNSDLNALGGGTNGNGGSVTLGTYDVGAVAVDLSTARIKVNANSTGDGQGGMLTVPFASGAGGTTTLNVNLLIQVDGAGAGAANFDGSIALNGVTCQQYPVGAGGANVPKFWGCLNPQSATAVPAAIATIPGALLTNIQGLSTYVFATIDDYNNFFSTAGTDHVTGGLGVTAPVAKNNTSAIWVSTATHDYTANLPGNMMHEIGHLLDNNMLVGGAHPSATASFRNAEALTVAAMTGQWADVPPVQSPTCVQVFGAVPNLCAGFPNTSPWNIFKSRYIGGQNEFLEMFAQAFANCSNYPVFDANENTAQQSIYMKDVWTYMNTMFWTGGCTRHE